eukprot:577003-Pyramimonas_sp.AAC.1
MYGAENMCGAFSGCEVLYLEAVEARQQAGLAAHLEHVACVGSRAEEGPHLLVYSPELLSLLGERRMHLRGPCRCEVV